MTTVYEHDGQELYVDQNDEYEIEDIRIHFSQFNEVLKSATYTVIPPEKEGDSRKVVFAKKVGTKGAEETDQTPAGQEQASQDKVSQTPSGQNPSNQIQASQKYAVVVISIISDLPPTHLKVFDYLDRFLASDKIPDPHYLVLHQDEILSAIAEAEKIADVSRNAVEQCLKLTPVPYTSPNPIWF